MHLNTCKVLCCPGCHGTLEPAGFNGAFIEEGVLACSACQRKYPVRGGIPIFLGDQLSVKSTGDAFSALDEDSRQKVLQREWHDRARLDESYKRAAYGSRTLYSYLLYYEMREMEHLFAREPYSRVANICAGHGFELEFLSKFCNNILAVDISWNSLRLALDRASELGVNVEAVCADAENLPLRDGSFNLVFAHHSLHHLPRPIRGLEEMMRISQHHVAFVEPAKGLMRTLLTHLGIKPEVEESGNFVYEFGVKDIQAICSNQHQCVRYFHKWLITGLADEPAWFRSLDSSRITPLLCGAISFGNRILGNLLGTKCSFLLEVDDRRAAALPFSSRSTAGEAERENSRFAREAQPGRR